MTSCRMAAAPLRAVRFVPVMNVGPFIVPPRTRSTANAGGCRQGEIATVWLSGDPPLGGACVGRGGMCAVAPPLPAGAATDPPAVALELEEVAPPRLGPRQRDQLVPAAGRRGLHQLHLGGEPAGAGRAVAQGDVVARTAHGHSFRHALRRAIALRSCAGV